MVAHSCVPSLLLFSKLPQCMYVILSIKGVVYEWLCKRMWAYSYFYKKCLVVSFTNIFLSLFLSCATFNLDWIHFSGKLLFSILDCFLLIFFHSRNPVFVAFVLSEVTRAASANIGGKSVSYRDVKCFCLRPKWGKRTVRNTPPTLFH